MIRPNYILIGDCKITMAVYEIICRLDKWCAQTLHHTRKELRIMPPVSPVPHLICGPQVQHL